MAYGNSDEDSDEYDSSEETQETKVKVNGSPAASTSIPPEATASTSSTLNLKLPTPKKLTTNTVIEEDDEFLHKKAVPTSEPPPKPIKRTKVQITIPALQKVDENEKLPKKVIGAEPNKPTGLLNLLPKPSFGGYKKSTTSVTNANSSTSTTKTKESNGFIPHSVAKLGAAPKKPIKKIPATNANVDENSDSDSSDNDDFFSFHSENKLPEVSQQEINAMVAKKAADMKTATSTYLQNMGQQPDVDIDEPEIPSEESQIDEEAMKALCGAKRARRGDGPSVVIDLSGDQVLPNRDEWLRNQLQSTTEYQPRGMVDEEPAAGTKKKHQITYLAHQAKANEQELQAMWAANRHTRRQTQNKYGF